MTAPPTPPHLPPHDPFRAPLPPGDPLAWDILLAGTSLEGSPWPGWGDDGEPATRQGIRAGDGRTRR